MYDIPELLDRLLQSDFGWRKNVSVYTYVLIICTQWQLCGKDGTSLVEQLGYLKYICLSSHPYHSTVWVW